MRKGNNYFRLIVLLLFVSVLIVVNGANAQDPIPQPPFYYFFESLTTKGKVEIEHNEGGVKEKFEIKVKFKLDSFSNGIDPFNEHVTLDFDRGIAGIEDPIWLVQIPPYAWVLAQNGKGYKLVSPDPQQSGVMVYLRDANGNIITDLTPGITEFKAGLKPKKKGWNLKIKSTWEGNAPTISPIMGSAVGTTMAIGDDIGKSIAERLEIFQGHDPQWRPSE